MSINPRPAILRSNARVIRVFQNAYNDLYKKLSNALSYKNNPEFTVISLYMLNKFVEDRIQELDEDLNDTVTDENKSLYYIGYGLCLMALYDSIGKKYTLNGVLKEVSRVVDQDSILKLRNATMKDLLSVTRNTEYSLKKLIRNTLSKHLNVRNMKNMDREDLAQQLIKEIEGQALKKGIKAEMIAIVDKAGRRWKLDNYVRMVTKTKAQEVVVSGIKDYVQEHNGHGDLARIPFNPLTNDPCLPFQGLIISMTGATPGYRTYDEIRATGHIFHPNCRHTPIPYWSFDDIPENVKEKHKKQEKAVNNALK